MKSWDILLLIFLLFFNFHTSQGQTSSRPSFDLILLADQVYTEDHINVYLKGSDAQISELSVDFIGNKAVPIYHIAGASIISTDQVVQQIKKIPFVNALQENRIIDLRSDGSAKHLDVMSQTIDPLFEDQWYLKGHSTEPYSNNAEEAWAFIDSSNNTNDLLPLAAVIDDGTYLNHPDLQGSHWINEAEVPSNNIDDDQNGYVDDYRGWNVYLNNDDIDAGSHGVGINGIMAAASDNGIGIKSINANIPVLTIASDLTSEANLIQAYIYAAQFREKYNQSNGQVGALVVSINTSWGINGGNPEDFPIWCSIYDYLGTLGILIPAAATNLSWDMDIEGDMPCACNSDFLFTIASTDQEGALKSGYGIETCDIAAPGHHILSTSESGDYEYFYGTSYATPQINAAIALLYSQNCNYLNVLRQYKPDQAALWVKQLIMEGSAPQPQLTNKIKSGSILDIGNVLNMQQEWCQQCQEPIVLNETIEIQANSLNFEWVNLEADSLYNVYIRPYGTQLWTLYQDVEPGFTLQNLENCTAYEYYVEVICQNMEEKVSSIYSITTGDCCGEDIQNIHLSNLSYSDASISWDPEPWALTYEVNYKLHTDTIWNTLESLTPLVILNNLTPCSTYDFSVRPSCVNNENSITQYFQFETQGCSNCDVDSYCSSAGYSGAEWIEYIEVEDQIFTSGQSTSGYQDFSNMDLFTFTKGEDTYTLKVGPGSDQTLYTRSVKVWIDFNFDTTFSEDELVLSQLSEDLEPVTQNFIIPENALSGQTKMRVSMKYMNNPVDITPCQNNFLGEVEDYCVQIIPVEKACDPIQNIEAYEATPECLYIEWLNNSGSITYKLQYRSINEPMWSTVFTSLNYYHLQDYSQEDTLILRIQNYCEQGQSDYSTEYTFTAQGGILSTNTTLSANAYKVWPNPFHQQTLVEGLSPNLHYEISMFNSKGRLFFKENVHGVDNYLLQLKESVPSGVYYLQLRSKEGTENLKIILL